MNTIPLKAIKKALSDNKDVAFAYVFGSAAGNTNAKHGSDLDLAVYFFKDPDPDRIYEFINNIEDVIGENVLDLLVLNNSEDFILRNEVLKGDLIFCRDIDLHAAFFSWTLRMYEDEMLRMIRFQTVQLEHIQSNQ